MALIDVIRNKKIITVIGLAKNTGKTVAVNQLLEEFHKDNKIIGISSVGLDGEAIDSINNLIRKPNVLLRKGSFVSSTYSLLKKKSVKILDETKYNTSLGKVVIAKMLKTENVEIAGPASVKKMEEVCKKMLEYNVDNIIIDGAINRKAFASSSLVNGFIVSTGAVLGDKVEKIVSETNDNLSLLLLKSISDKFVMEVCNKSKGLLFINKDNSFVNTEINLFLNDISQYESFFTDDLSYVYFKNTITDSLVSNIINMKKEGNLTIVSNNFSNYFLSKRIYLMAKSKGVNFKVLKSSNVLAMTVNPVSPLKYSVNSNYLVAELKRNNYKFPIWDVMSDEYC